MGGNQIGPNSDLFGGPRSGGFGGPGGLGGQPRMPGMPYGDPSLGGDPMFQPMGINDLHPDLPGMNNPMFQNRRGGPGSGFGGGPGFGGNSFI